MGPYIGKFLIDQKPFMISKAQRIEIFNEGSRPLRWFSRDTNPVDSGQSYILWRKKHVKIIAKNLCRDGQIRFTKTFKRFYDNMRRFQQFKALFSRSFLLSNVQFCYPIEEIIRQHFFMVLKRYLFALYHI